MCQALSEADIAHHPGEPGDHPRGLDPPDRLDGAMGVGRGHSLFFASSLPSSRARSIAGLSPNSSSSNTWRISISPSWPNSAPASKGTRLAHSMASSSDLAWMIQYPATSSFDSVKGPSMTVRFPPENLTRAPSALGWRPERSSRTPAFASSSLYLPIAASSSSLGSWPGFGSPLIIKRNRMVLSFPFEPGPGRSSTGSEPWLYQRVGRGRAKSTRTAISPVSRDENGRTPDLLGQEAEPSSHGDIS